MAIRKIGGLYLSSRHFQDEANQTVGQPGLTAEVLMNRRAVTARTTYAGEMVKMAVRRYFFEKYGIEVKLVWSRYCGCSMCPCSPGFEIKVDSKYLENYCGWYKSVEKSGAGVNIWVNEDETLYIKEGGRGSGIIATKVGK